MPEAIRIESCMNRPSLGISLLAPQRARPLATTIFRLQIVLFHFMASIAPRRQGPASTTADIVLLPALKSCLVNLPSSLVSLLLNSNTVAQNVVVELSYKQANPPGSDARGKLSNSSHSFYFGWTGMQSQPRLAPMVGRDGIRSAGRQEQDVATVEVDATFGRLLGLSEGIKVCIDSALGRVQRADGERGLG